MDITLMISDEVLRVILLKGLEEDAKSPIIEWKSRSDRFRLNLAMNINSNKQGDGKWRVILNRLVLKGIITRSDGRLIINPNIIKSIELKYTAGYVSTLLLGIQRNKKIEVLSFNF